MYSWTSRDVESYLAQILGRAPMPDAEGKVRIPGPSALCRERGHFATMSIHIGAWVCLGCSAGQLEDFQGRLSGVLLSSMSGPRLAAEEIRELIRDAEDNRRERVQRAWTLIAQYALPAPTATILRHIARKPGVSRRTLQHLAHLRRRKFRAAIRELQTKAMVSYQDVPSTAGRTRRLYFPAPLPESSVSGQGCEP